MPDASVVRRRNAGRATRFRHKERGLQPVTNETSAKTVMLYATVDTFDLDHGPVVLALGLCETVGASLTGFLLNLDANVPPSPDGRSLEQMRKEFALREEANGTNADALLTQAAQRGVDAETITTLDHSRGVIGCLADHARLPDLDVIGADTAGMMSDRLIAENLLFEIGRPMLVAPAGYTGAFAWHRIAVAWDNSRVAARALGDALALFPGIEEVVLLSIGGEKAIHSSLDNEDIERALKRRGVAARVERQELNGRSIGEAIQGGARELGAGLLVMGGYGHSRLRDFVLGGATLSVLRDPQLPVLLSH